MTQPGWISIGAALLRLLLVLRVDVLSGKRHAQLFLQKQVFYQGHYQFVKVQYCTLLELCPQTVARTYCSVPPIAVVHSWRR
jgi:hypothetical protein